MQKREGNSEPDVTMLQKTTGNRGGNNAKPTSTRRKFIEAYEEHFGNVTAACRIAGISRQTYYRWMESMSRTNIKFRERLKRTKPKERLADLLEGAFVKRVLEGSDSLIKFGLERAGQSRGWSEAPKVELDFVDKVAKGFNLWLEANPQSTTNEKLRWLRAFAQRGGVPVSELAEKVGFKGGRV